MNSSDDSIYDVLAFAAHPDDIEVAMGGTAARLAAEGHSFLIVDLCPGEPARHGTPGERHEQARRAARLLGVDRTTLSLQDRLIQDTMANRIALAALIRRHCPSLVFTTHSGTACVHPDHASMGALVEGAVFYARLPKWEEVAGVDASVLANTKPHDIKRLFYYFCRMEPPWQRFDFAFAVEKYYGAKQEAVAAYESVFGDVSRSALVSRVEAQDRYFGEMFDVGHAEVFQSRAPLLLKDFDAIGPVRYG